MAEEDSEAAQAVVDFAQVLQETFGALTPSWKWKERKAELIKTISLSDEVSEEEAAGAIAVTSLALARAHDRQKKKGAAIALAGFILVIAAIASASVSVALAIFLGFLGGLILLPAGGRYWARHVGHSRKWKKVAHLEV